MIVLTPLIIPTLLGYLSLSLVLGKVEIRNKFLLLLSLSSCVGFGMVSLILFWSYAADAAHAPTIAVSLISLLLIGFALLKLSPLLKQFGTAPARRSPLLSTKFKTTEVITCAALIILLGYVAMRYFNYLAAETTFNPFGGWDARYMWNIKARFYVRAPKWWLDQFHHPRPWWVLPDYPHLLPASTAWGWLILGHESLGWPTVIGCAFFFSLVAILVWFLSSRFALKTAIGFGTFLLSIPAYQFWSATQYADLPLCYFMTASALVVLAAFQSKSQPLWILSGFLAGLGVWTKNEGILFLVALSLLVTIRLIQIKEGERWKFWVLFIIGAATPVLTAVYLKWQLGGPGIYLGSSRTLVDYWRLTSDTNRILFIGAALLAFMRASDWLFLWELGGIALTVSLFRQIFRKTLSFQVQFLISLLILMLAGYSFIYLITPIELSFHIKYTATRLLLHVGVLLLAIIAETFTLRDFNEQPLA